MLSLLPKAKISKGKRFAIIVGSGEPVSHMKNQTQQLISFLKNQHQIKYQYTLIEPDDHFTVLSKAWIIGLFFAHDKKFLQW